MTIKQFTLIQFKYNRIIARKSYKTSSARKIRPNICVNVLILDEVVLGGPVESQVLYS